MTRILIAVPVFNEARTVVAVLREVLRHAAAIPEALRRPDLSFAVLALDDHSTDATSELLKQLPIETIRQPRNRGYGFAMQETFRLARERDADWCISIDCDEQHEPSRLVAFVRAALADKADVISGTRYFDDSHAHDDAPAERQAINATLTRELNAALDLRLTDAFCGFKAYRTRAVANLALDACGYEFPMQFWVLAASARLRIQELPIRRIYPDFARRFGNGLDDGARRLAHYRLTMQRALQSSSLRHGAP